MCITYPTGIHHNIFPSFQASVTHSPAAANGPRGLIFSMRIYTRLKEHLSMYITYNLVSTPTPWAVAGPYGQLASLVLEANVSRIEENTWTGYMFWSVNIDQWSWNGALTCLVVCPTISQVASVGHRSLSPKKSFRNMACLQLEWLEMVPTTRFGG